MMKSLLCKWCDKAWLITTYGIGLLMTIWAAVGWGAWEMPKKLLCLLAIALPLRVFEENTFPGRFHYMMNLVQRSKRPNVGPMNRLSDMVSNFGGEVLFVILFLWGGNVGSSVLVAFFGIGESVVHTVFGILTYQKLKGCAKRTIYGPGLATSYLTLLPLSVYAIRYLTTQTITFTDVLTDILLIVCVILLLIRIPILVFGKYQPEYAFSSSGYFKKYERSSQ